MILNVFDIIFIMTTLLGAVGLAVIIYSRNKEDITSRLFVLMLILVCGYIVSHSIHFVFLRSSDVTVLDMSCHSFLLIILVTLTFFTWNFPAQRKMGVFRSLSILLPSIALLIWLWTGELIKESHFHEIKFEAHYGSNYPIFLAWYIVLLFINFYWLYIRIRNEKDEKIRGRTLFFITGLLLTNLISFIFGLFLPWILGFYFLVEVSPLTFLVGVILFAAVAVGKYDMFPAALTRVKSFTINRKVFLSALVLVPIIILLVEIPLITLIFNINSNKELINLFVITLIGGLLVSVSMSFVIIKIISDPLNILTTNATEIEKGNYGITVDYSSNDEIGELAKAFNKMSETLQNNSRELSQNASRISLLLNAFDKSSVAIMIVDSHFEVIESNQTFCNLIDKNRNEIIGMHIRNVQFFKFNKPNCEEIFDKIKVNGRYEGEVYWRDEYQKDNYLLISATPTSNENGDSNGYLFAEVDITDKKILEIQLHRTEKLAALGEMAAVLAHEIKTPLTSIKMNAEILNEFLDFQEEEKKSFNIIQKEINRLNNLVKDVLNFSRQTDIEYSKIDLGKLIYDIKVQLQGKLESDNIELINKIDNLLIEVDSEKLRQVFLNLIENSIEAIKKHGAIIISSGALAENGDLQIFVEDSGGSNLDPHKIFEPFYTSKASGTGLGLSISHKIISQHNGELKLVESSADRTIFGIVLPIKKSISQK